jgi:uncharacterized OsmC-like protein
MDQGEIEAPCCSIDYLGMKKRHENFRAQISQDPGARHQEREATVRVVDNYVKVASVRGFKIFSDEPSEVGGTNKYPRPTEYIIAGVALCEMAMLVGSAADLDVKLNDIELRAKAICENGAMYDIPGSPPPGFLEVVFDLMINTDSEPSKVKELVRLAEKRCPGYNTLVNPVKVSTNITLNGRPI